MRIELIDRHAEHVDESIPLCDHDEYILDWGDIFTVNIDMDMPGWIMTSKLMEAKATVEIHLISKKHIQIIVNHADYLTAKKILDIT